MKGSFLSCSIRALLATEFLFVVTVATCLGVLAPQEAHAVPSGGRTPRLDSLYNEPFSFGAHQDREEQVKQDDAPMDDGMDANPGSGSSRDGITAGPNIGPGGRGGGLGGGGLGRGGGLLAGLQGGNSALLGLLMQMLMQNGKNGSGSSGNPLTGQSQNPFDPITQPAEYVKWEQQSKELADARKRLADAEKQKQQQDAQQKELAALRQKIAELEAKLNAQTQSPNPK